MTGGIVLITADSLRKDAVSYYGQSASTDTPNIDSLAEEGAVFHNAVANGPATVLSVPSLLTGRLHHEVTESTPTLPEQLSQAGYDTAAFCTNIQLFGPRLSPKKLDRGFDSFDTVLDTVREKTEFRFEWAAHRVAEHVQRWLGSDSRIYRGVANSIASIPIPIARPTPSAEVVNERAIEWLEQRDNDSPYFMWLFQLDTHEPWLPDEGEESRSLLKGEKHRTNRKLRYFKELLTEEEVDTLRELYGDSVEYWDKQVGELVTRLRELDPEVTVVITSDHGELFGEHGEVGHPSSHWNELINVPLIINGPTVDDGDYPTLPVQNSDVPASIADLADVSDSGIDTVPLQRVGEQKPDREGVPSVLNYEATEFAFQTEEWKYVRLENDELLYERGDEARDLSDQKPGVVNRLSGRLNERLQKGGDSSASQTGEVEVDDEIEDRLRSLGYVNE